MSRATRGVRGLSVEVSDARGRRLSGTDVAGLGPWLARAAPARTRGRVSIAIVSDAAMRRLNLRYRGVDTATDVLSFPAGDASVTQGKHLPFLGDLAIARGVAARQARACGHSLRVEIRVLALHGLLHLLGYDHEVDAGEMARLEDRLRRRAGLPSGLIDRGAHVSHPRHA